MHKFQCRANFFAPIFFSFLINIPMRLLNHLPSMALAQKKDNEKSFAGRRAKNRNRNEFAVHSFLFVSNFLHLNCGSSALPLFIQVTGCCSLRNVCITFSHCNFLLFSFVCTILDKRSSTSAEWFSSEPFAALVVPHPSKCLQSTNRYLTGPRGSSEWSERHPMKPSPRPSKR